MIKCHLSLSKCNRVGQSSFPPAPNLLVGQGKFVIPIHREWLASVTSQGGRVTNTPTTPTQNSKLKIQNSKFVYIYVDYIHIHAIALDNDVICLDGAYQDPVTGKLKFTYFEADFNYFYNFLTEHDFDNTDYALEAMAATLSDKEASWIDLGEKCIEMHDMVFRLTTMVDNVDDSKQVGYFINDGYVLEDGCLSFEQYLQPPTFDGNDRGRKVLLLRTFKTMSGHLTALALRYAYYLCMEGKMPYDHALTLAELQNSFIFASAKAAFNYINLQPNAIVFQHTKDRK